jgi:hypothetical protein
MKKIIKISYELEVGDRFISINNGDWSEEYRNKLFTVKHVDRYGYHTTFDNCPFKSCDINWEETIKLNEIKEND